MIYLFTLPVVSLDEKEVLILLQCSLLMSPFMISAFYVLFKKSLPIPKAQRYFLVFFFPLNFFVYLFSFRAIICLEFIFVRQGLKFVFYISSWCSTIFWEDHPLSPLLFSVTFVINQIAVFVWVCFWTLTIPWSFFLTSYYIAP